MLRLSILSMHKETERSLGQGMLSYLARHPADDIVFMFKVIINEGGWEGYKGAKL